jgi:hypothetical protein
MTWLLRAHLPGAGHGVAAILDGRQPKGKDNPISADVTTAI